MKDEHFRKYLFISLAGAVGVILCIVFFFVLFRFNTVLYGLGKIRDILMPFIYGAVIAYILTPVCNFIERKLNRILKKRVKEERKAERFSAFMGITFSFLFGFLVIYLLLAMVLPQVFTSVAGIVDAFPNTVIKWSGFVESFLADNELLSNYVEQFMDVAADNMETWLTTKLLPNMQTIVSGVSAGLVSAVVVLKNILVGIFAAVYLMANRRKFSAQAKKLTYSFFKVSAANAILDEVQYIHRMFGGFINGKLLDSLIIGVICFVVLNILNMPYAMLVSVIVGVTNIIPFFGPFIGAIPSALIILTVSPVQCIYFLIFVLILQQFDGNFLGPKILGDTTGLSSFWVLFSILLFGGMMGFVGMIVGVPTFAVLYDLVKKVSNKYLRKKNLSTDTDEYEELASVQKEGDAYRYVHREKKTQE